jgi:hypothetical protein
MQNHRKYEKKVSMTPPKVNNNSTRKDTNDSEVDEIQKNSKE